MSSGKLVNKKFQVLNEDYFINGDKTCLNQQNIISFGPNLFSSMSETETFILNFNSIISLNAGSFEGLVKLKKLELTKNTIDSIESNAFRGLNQVTTLIINHNIIHRLQQESFKGLDKLENLKFFNNNVKLIERGAFEGLSSLKEMFFENNTIDTIERDIFHDLKEMFFENNTIDTIERDIFHDLKNLTQLTLTNNVMKSVESFNALVNLKSFTMMNNTLQSIEPKTFNGLKKLEKINFNKNTIKEIKSDAFNGLTNISELNLNFNNISYIEANAFRGLKQLKELFIEDNNLETIAKDTFNGLINLEILKLSRNKIKSIDSDVFKDLRNLSELKLDHNRIRQIDDSLTFNLANLVRLKHLDLSVNFLKGKLILQFGSEQMSSLKLEANFLNDVEFDNLIARERINISVFLNDIPEYRITELNNLNYFTLEDFTKKLSKDGFVEHLDLTSQYQKYPHISSLKYRESLKMFTVITGTSMLTLNFHFFYLVFIFCVHFFFIGKNGTGKTSILNFLKENFSIPLVYDTNSIASNKSQLIGDLLNFCQYELEGLNMYLSQNNFKYNIYIDSNIGSTSNVILNEKNIFLGFGDQNKLIILNLNQISPGERMILYFLLWQYVIIRDFIPESSTESNISPQHDLARYLLLFDEIDSNMHPSAILELISALKTIAKLGVQIILTTHNPTTVSFIEYENLYILERESDNPIGDPEKYQNLVLKCGKDVGKQYIFNQLTDKLIDIDSPRKIIYVEGSDRSFYETIKQAYFKQKKISSTLIVDFLPAKSESNSGRSDTETLMKAHNRFHNESNYKFSGKTTLT
jgi:Leucine-rich repeat (LRR) protein